MGRCNIELSCPAASAQHRVVFRYACTIPDDLQGDNCSDLLHLPRMMAGTFLPASHPAPTHCLCSLPPPIGTLPTLQNRFPEPQFLSPTGPGFMSFPHCTNCPLPQAPTRHFWPLISRRHLTYPLPPAIMESTTALPNLFSLYPTDHSPHKEFSDWGAGAPSTKGINRTFVPNLKLLAPRSFECVSGDCSDLQLSTHQLSESVKASPRPTQRSGRHGFPKTFISRGISSNGQKVG